MASDVFVDSSGLYALTDHRDSFHLAAKHCVAPLMRAGVGLVLTDYIIDEACTLAQARGGAYGALKLLEIVDESEAFRSIRIDEQRFERSKAFFRRHADQGYSFTDCT